MQQVDLPEPEIGDDGQRARRKANMDILQVVRSRSVDLDPVLYRLPVIGAISGRMNKRVLKPRPVSKFFERSMSRQRSSGKRFGRHDPARGPNRQCESARRIVSASCSTITREFPFSRNAARVSSNRNCPAH